VLVAIAASAVVLTVLLGYWTLLRDLHPLIPTLTDQARSDYAAVSVSAWPGPAWLWMAINHPLVRDHLIYQDPVLVTVVLLWLFPAIGLLQWRSSDPAGSGLVAPERTTRPRVVVLIGLAGGAAYALLVLLHRAVVHGWIAMNGGAASDEFLTVLAHWQITGAITAQAVVAFGVALWAKSFRVVRGLLAAFVTGMVAAAAVLGFIVVGGCIDAFSLRPGPCAWTITSDVARVTRLVLVEGSLAAIAGGLLGAALAGATRCTSFNRRAPEHPEQPTLRGLWRSARQPVLDSSGQVAADRKDP
jgi:hypothetical protein